MIDACADCLRRADLIAALAGHIEQEWRLRRGRPHLLAMTDGDLLAWSADAEADRRYRGFVRAAAVDRIEAAGLGAVCACAESFPEGLGELSDPPAVLHFAGDLALLDSSGAALVGARTPTDYGRSVAAGLARGLGAAGATVVSGMAMGIDSVAHTGALDTGRTVAVLATGADRAYPARSYALHRRILAEGCVVSELPPGHPPRRWAFPARNRLIAALSRATIVIEGGERSGSLITADFAAELGRAVGAVPGQVTSRMSAGPHALLKAGAELVRSTEDVLELLHGVSANPQPASRVPGTGGALIIGAGDPTSPAPRTPAPPPDLEPRLVRLLERVEGGAASLAQLAAAGEALTVARDLSELELRGLVTRTFAGRYVRALGG